jgi:hypothetical protein
MNYHRNHDLVTRLNRQRTDVTHAPNQFMDYHKEELTRMRGYRKATKPMPPAANADVCSGGWLLVCWQREP